MIKQFKTAVVTAIVVGMMGSVASPVYAAEKAKRRSASSRKTRCRKINRRSNG
ncbi:MAG: hypothetical protein P8090_09185 [Gammaproteobacteria bacterium]